MDEKKSQGPGGSLDGREEEGDRERNIAVERSTYVSASGMFHALGAGVRT